MPRLLMTKRSIARSPLEIAGSTMDLIQRVRARRHMNLRSFPIRGRALGFAVVPFSICLLLVSYLLGRCTTCAQEFGTDVPMTVLTPKAELLDQIQPKNELNDSAQAALLLSLIDPARLNQQPLRSLQRAWRKNRDAGCFEEILKRTMGLRLRDEFLAFAEFGVDQQLTDDKLALQAAVALTDRRKYKAAAAYYQKWLAIKPAQPVNYLQLLIRIEMGRLYYLSKEYELASEAFREVLKKLNSGKLPATQKQQLLRNSQTTYRLMARSFLKSGEVDLAETLFKVAHENDSDPIRFLSEAQVAFAKSDLVAAKNLVNRFIAKQPNNSEAFQLLLDIIKSEQKDATRVDSQFVTELERYRTDFQTGRVLEDLLVTYYLKTGKREEAVRLLEHQRNNSIWKDTANRKLLDIHCAADDLNKMSKCIQMEVDDHETLSKIRKSLTTWATKVQSRNEAFSQTLFGWLNKDYEQQELTLQIANCTLRMHLLNATDNAKRTGTSWQKNLQQTQDAIRKLHVTIVETDDLLASQKTRNLMILARECVATGRYELAIETFGQCLELNQDTWKTASGQRSLFEIYLARTYCHCQLSQPAQAEAELKRAESIQKISPSVMHLRGWMHLQFGKLDAAIVAYDAFLMKHDKVGNSASLKRLIERSRLELGFVFFLKKRNQLATEMIQQIYDRNPLGPDLAAFSRNNQKYTNQLNLFFELEDGVKNGGPFALGRDQAQKGVDR